MKEATKGLLLGILVILGYALLIGMISCWPLLLVPLS